MEKEVYTFSPLTGAILQYPRSGTMALDGLKALYSM